MEDSKKKPIMIGVIVVCLIVAGLITFARRGRGGGGIDDIPDDKMTLVKCNNPKCNAVYEMSEKQYFKQVQERFNPMARSTPAVPCEKCGENSVFRAIKCVNPSCGEIFFRDSVPGDIFDRCPKCKHSETIEIREKRRQQMDGG